MQKFLIEKDSIVQGKAFISGQDARHIVKVLRMGPQDSLILTDGHGTDYTGSILKAEPEKILIDITDQIPSTTESKLWITLCSGMLKNQKMDQIVNILTQLGVQEWIPFFCERSIPRPNKKQIQNRMIRWKTIAKEASKQCCRSRLILIREPIDFRSLFEGSSANRISPHSSFNYKIAFWEESNIPFHQFSNQFFPKINRSDERLIILVGPEGGFSIAEMALAHEKGFQSYSLGRRILRAETATALAIGLFQHILGDI